MASDFFVLEEGCKLLPRVIGADNEPVHSRLEVVPGGVGLDQPASCECPVSGQYRSCDS